LTPSFCMKLLAEVLRGVKVLFFSLFVCFIVKMQDTNKILFRRLVNIM